MAGIGPTDALNLRVSVATLSRVIFPRPGDGAVMLALENKVTLVPGEIQDQIVLRAQPFGGAVRISNPARLLSEIGRFNYDSERSRIEQDFRVNIHPGSWDALLACCLEHLLLEDDTYLDSDPARELMEEFQDTLGINLQPDQYTLTPARIVIENEPSPSENLRAGGNPTVRIYRVDDVDVLDPALSRMIVANSEANPGPALKHRAERDAQTGGRGRANAVFAAPLADIRDAYLAIQPALRGERLLFGQTILAGNVAAVLEGVEVPKYAAVGRSG